MRTPYDKDTVLANMQASRDRGSARTFKPGETAQVLPAVTTSLDDSLPYAFFNARGDLVGFDVEMAQQFGTDLGVAVEFVPVNRSVLDTGLDPAVCDLVMSGVAITAYRAVRVQFSAPYLDETVAFLVRDHRTSSFTTWDDVRAMGRIRLGVPRAPYFMRKVQEELKDVEIVPVDGMDD